MPMRVENSSVQSTGAPLTMAAVSRIRETSGGAAPASMPAIPPAAEQETHAANSPAISSLLSMANLKADSASLQLYIGEILEKARDTSNMLERGRIDQLTHQKMAFLKEKQARLEEAQKKLDEAEQLASNSKIFAAARCFLSAVMGVTSVALLATGLGAGVGVAMLASAAAICTASVANDALILDNGKGLAGRIAEAAGARANAAAYFDMGFTLLVGLFSAAFGLPYAALGALMISVVDLTNGGLSYLAMSARADGMDLASLSKHYEAIIQQLSGFLQQSSDSLIRSNDRNSELLSSLMRSFSDLSQALARARFAS